MSAVDTLFGHNIGLFNIKCCSGVKLIVLTKLLEHFSLSTRQKEAVSGPQCHSVLVICGLIPLLHVFIFWQLTNCSQSNACFLVSDIRSGCENAKGNVD
jgi:hypothetical protein